MKLDEDYNCEPFEYDTQAEWQKESERIEKEEKERQKQEEIAKKTRQLDRAKQSATKLKSLRK